MQLLPIDTKLFLLIHHIWDFFQESTIKHKTQNKSVKSSTKIVKNNICYSIVTTQTSESNQSNKATHGLWSTGNYYGLNI